MKLTPDDILAIDHAIASTSNDGKTTIEANLLLQMKKLLLQEPVDIEKSTRHLVDAAMAGIDHIDLSERQTSIICNRMREAMHPIVQEIASSAAQGDQASTTKPLRADIAQGLLALLGAIDAEHPKDFVDEVCKARDMLPLGVTEEALSAFVETKHGLLSSPLRDDNPEPDHVQALQHLADCVVIANATGCPEIFQKAVQQLVDGVRILKMPAGSITPAGR